ncbi:MAG: serine/threonine-protein kinase [Myxococcota bacterium]
MEENIPQQIGRYTVDRLLGAGAMGFVYLGRDPELDRAVAIKTVRNLDMDENALTLFLERFRNEARAAARLHHPHIVQVYDVGEEPDIGPYLVFEYVAGSTLKDVIRKGGALKPAAVARLAIEVGEALEVAHEAGIIHRDIKPDNLLITPDGRAKLADFGVARVPNATLTREGQFLGTPCYAAPETLAEGAYGVQSDLFSFAAVLYEAATGKRAFPGDDALSVAHRVIHDEPATPTAIADDPATIPKPVEAILLSGLSKRAEGRPPSAMELSASLQAAYLESGLVRADELGRPPSRRITLTSEPETNSGSGLWLAIVALLAAVGVAFVLAFDDGPAPTPIDAGLGASAGLGDARTDAAVDEALGDADEGDGPLDEGQAPEIDDEEDAATLDQGLDADLDAGQGTSAEGLSSHEREEAAKDALDRARAALAAGDADAVRAALTQAEAFDPGNPDIEDMRAELAELQLAPLPE